MKPPQAPMHRVHRPSPRPQSLLCARHNLTLCLGARGTDLAAMWPMGGTDCLPLLASGLLRSRPSGSRVSVASVSPAHRPAHRALSCKSHKSSFLGVVAVPRGLAGSLEQAGAPSHVPPWPPQGIAILLWVTALSLGTRFMSHKEEHKPPASFHRADLSSEEWPPKNKVFLIFHSV